ncbi:hypothetical protein, partial [Actinocrinis sp.]|uniref:hypothetical protein n=1 Tax=Actinocrinis sp. TaxID=1920516 RepID=UPI002D3E7F4F
PTQGDATVICPSGFWGFRHQVGMPLLDALQASVSSEIVSSESPPLAVLFSTDRALVERAAHLQQLRSLTPRVRMLSGSSRSEEFQILSQTDLSTVYVYGLVGDGPSDVLYLQIGAPGEQGFIHPADLRAARINWHGGGPLVFMNPVRAPAAPTGQEPRPEWALDFARSFVTACGAAGVLAPSVPLSEPLACAFGEECLRRFFSGMTIGEAVRSARLALLKAGSPLGLSYVQFARNELRLEHGAAQPA